MDAGVNGWLCELFQGKKAGLSASSLFSLGFAF
jgi:hypothetical protein